MTTKAKTKKPPRTKKQPATKKESVTFQLPAVCPNCRSATKGELITVTRVREIKGRVLNFGYQQVEWSKRQCECGQVLDVRTYSGRSDA
jgi:hypothetical protein